LRIKRYICILIISILFFQISNTVLAKNSDNEVTFIYIPGILAVNPISTENNVISLHKHFANKKLGEYTVLPEYKIILWGDIPRDGESYEIFKDGLIDINTEHNKSKCKETYEAKTSLLLNPIYRFLLIQDSGSSANAVYWRNSVHNHLFDIAWYLFNEANKEQIFKLIQEKIDETDGKFVLIGNSFGAVVALDFVLNKVVLDASKRSNQENFLGLITTADATNTVFAPVFSNQFNPDESKDKRKKFIDYFVINRKFWISYNHRSDIISTGLSPILTSYNDEGEGFIVSKINKAGPLYNFIHAFKFWNRNNGLLESHNWCFHNPKEFTNKVLGVYKENTVNKTPNTNK